ncbi:glycosyltransferase [Arsenicicoccus dermatophilus]|uniref:glycosyltransferase n=1 Tax=Arsenicicoccus dermatophilus TaxID=1076331 RepID=UPI003916E360
MPSPVRPALSQAAPVDTRAAVETLVASRPGWRLETWGSTARPAQASLPDFLVVDARERGGRVRALLAGARGIPVLWVGSAAPVVIGAPVHGAETVDADSVRRILLAANRAGASTQEPGPDVSLVITTLDEGGALADLLEILRPQLRAGDECIVIDGGSTDDCVDQARRRVHGDERFVIEVHQGAGISQGRNIGVRRARHDHIVCTDAGCHPAEDWLEAMRSALGSQDAPGLVSATYQVGARDAVERAQALACYPDEFEARHRDVWTRLYTSVFGTAYDPRFCVGRCVAFTREAWEAVGGFPEHLATGEDVTFGLAIAERFPVAGTTDARLVWDQRDSLGATWRMYRNYGRASVDGGDRRLLLRDGARGAAYVLAPVLAATRRGRRVVALGGLLYLSVPVRRAIRQEAPVAAVAAIPLAMATKDLGKLWGACQGFARTQGWGK